MNGLDNLTVQWLLLLGAMLGSKAVRDNAVTRLAVEDAPDAMRELWAALRREDNEAVKACMEELGVTRTNGTKTVPEALTRTLQERALADYCRAAVTRAAMSGLLTPDQVVGFLEKMAVNIRAKQEGLK